MRDMDDYQIIAGHFQDTIEAISLAVDELESPLSLASDCLVAALVANHNVLVYAGLTDQPPARQFCTAMLHSGERERPPLPCLLLEPAGTGPATAQLKALGHPGDALLVFGDHSDLPGLQALLHTARDRGVAVVAVATAVHGGIVDLLGDEDVLLPVLAPAAQSLEIKSMVVNCLVTLIESRLFGPLTRN